MLRFVSLDAVLEFVEHKAMARDALASLLLIILIIAFRAVALRAIRGAKWASDEQRLRWSVQSRNILAIVLGFGLLLIWASELKTLAFSLVAFAVAFVIAIKELLLCAMGGFVRSSTRAFKVGDRIEVNGVRGDVIDTGVLTTTLLETGPAFERTGRAITLANAVFLSSHVVVETFADEYLLHIISVPLHSEWDWRVAERELLAAASEEAAAVVGSARKSLTTLAARHGLKLKAVPDGASLAEPVVLLSIEQGGQVVLSVRVPSRVRFKGILEQQILREFLLRMSKLYGPTVMAEAEETDEGEPDSEPS